MIVSRSRCDMLPSIALAVLITPVARLFDLVSRLLRWSSCRLGRLSVAKICSCGASLVASLHRTHAQPHRSSRRSPGSRWISWTTCEPIRNPAGGEFELVLEPVTRWALIKRSVGEYQQLLAADSDPQPSDTHSQAPLYPGQQNPKSTIFSTFGARLVNLPLILLLVGWRISYHWSMYYRLNVIWAQITRVKNEEDLLRRSCFDGWHRTADLEMPDWDWNSMRATRRCSVPSGGH